MSIASARPPIRHVFLRDMLLSASIGVYPHEHAAPQRVRINVDLGVHDDPAGDGSDRLFGMAEAGGGVYRGNAADVMPGQWDLVLEGDVDGTGARMFLSRNRVVLN